MDALQVATRGSVFWVRVDGVWGLGFRVGSRLGFRMFFFLIFFEGVGGAVREGPPA